MFPRSKQEMGEELVEWVRRLNERTGEGIMVVEGKKDIRALRNLGVRGRIVHMNKGLSILTFLESLKMGTRPFEEIGDFQEIIVLTDWDRTGGRLAHKLKDACENLGISCDMDARKELASLTGKWVNDVESVDTLLE